MTANPSVNSNPLPVDPARTAVIVVDVQRAFTDMVPFPMAPALDEVLPRMARFVDEARRVGAMVVRVRNIMPRGDALKVDNPMGEYMLSILEPGTAGVEYDPAISSHPADIEIVKPRYSSFYRTDLESILRSRGIETTVILGLTTNVCVQTTARDSFQRDFDTIVLSDCCAECFGEPFPLVNHEAALESMARNFGTVCTSDQIIAAWDAPVMMATT